MDSVKRLSALPFHLAVETTSGCFLHARFANNFLFLILAVSVKVTNGAATVSSPALPQLSRQLSPSSVLEGLSCSWISGQLISSVRKGPPVPSSSRQPVLSMLAAVTARQSLCMKDGAGVRSWVHRLPGQLADLVITPLPVYSVTICWTLCSRHS